MSANPVAGSSSPAAHDPASAHHPPSAGPQVTPLSLRAPSRRVSFVIPFPAHPASTPLLKIPELGEARGIARLGDPRPLVLYDRRRLPLARPQSCRGPKDDHPRHCLGVNALALDTSTAIAPSSGGESSRRRSPEGILYTGGKDGLIASWELGLATKKRKNRYGVYLGSARARRGALSSSTWDSESSDSGAEEDDAEGASYQRTAQRNGSGSGSYSPSSKPSQGLGGSSAGDVFRNSVDGSANTSGGRRGAAPEEPDIPYEEQWEIDDERLSKPGPRTAFRQCVQSHTHWCNDLVLCNYNQTVISASSDRTIKAWSPHSPDLSMTPTTIGTHIDYVRCLAHSREAGWVASGGLDRQIKLWDVANPRRSPLVEFATNDASVYSLATNASGTLLAAGSPARLLRLWDPRVRPSPQGVATLVGHTDNVRSLLLSADGHWLLSASSDATVKLWSLDMQRCLHTFTYPSSAVWSLWSQHPALEVFYSGDRAGFVCKVDIEGCGDPSNGECVVLCKVDEDERGEGTLAPGDEAIQKLVGADDVYIWTATGSSTVKRWRDVRPRWERRDAIADDLGNTIVDSAQDEVILPSPSLMASPALRISPKPLAGSHTANILNQLSTPTQAFPVIPNNQLTKSVSGALVAFAEQPTVHPYRSTPPGSGRGPASALSTSPTALAGHSIRGPLGPVTGADPTKKDGLPLESLVPLLPPDDVLRGVGLGGLGSLADPDLSPSVHSSYSLARVVNHPRVASFQTPSGQTFGTTLRTPPPQNQHVDSVYALEHARPQSVNEPDTHIDRVQDNQAWQLYELRESESEAIPLRDSPDALIEGRAGLVRSELLNDRRHAVTVDTKGCLALWDVITATCIGHFDADELLKRPPAQGTDGGGTTTSSPSISSGGSINSSRKASPREILDRLKERLEGFATTAHWCTVETQTGLLTVHLEESRCFDAEVYADEANVPDGLLEAMKEDHRITLGRWVLRNLFEGFVRHQTTLRGLLQQDVGGVTTGHRRGSRQGSLIEQIEHKGRPAHLDSRAPPLPGSPTRPSKQANGQLARTPGMTIALATPALTPALRPDIPPTSSRTHGELTPIAGSPRRPTTELAMQQYGIGRAAPNDYFSLTRSADPPGPMEAEADGKPDGSESEESSSRASLATGLRTSTTAVETPSGAKEEPTAPPEAPLSPSVSATSLLGRWRGFTKGGSGKKAQVKLVVEGGPATAAPQVGPSEPAQTPAVPAIPEHLVHLTPQQRLQHQTLEAVFSRPIQPCGPLDAPPLRLREDVAILISEESSHSGAWEVTYRGLVRTTEDDGETLEGTMPGWLLDFLLGNRALSAHEPIKVAFVLEPEGGEEAAGLSEMPNGNTRLTASRVLRMRKVAAYIATKLELDFGPALPPIGPPQSASPSGATFYPSLSAKHGTVSCSTGSSSSDHAVAGMLIGRRPEEEIELCCRGVHIPWTMGLGSVKQFVWGKGGDVVIGYRLGRGRACDSPC